MSTPNIDLDKIQSFIDRREGIVNTAIGTLSLGVNYTEATFNVFKGFLMSFLSTQSPNDASFFSSKFSDIFTKMIQPIPEAELAATGITALTHNKFATLAQAILAHPMCDEFFHVAIKDGCGVMVKELSALNNDMSKIEDTFIQHLTDLEPYIDMLKNNPDLAFQSVVEKNQPEITKMSEELYLGLFELRASLAKHGNFAARKASTIEAKATELNTLLTGIDGLKSMPSSIGDLTNKLMAVESMWGSANRIFTKMDDMAVIDDSIQSEIDFGSLFEGNIKKILGDGRRIKDYCANLSSLTKFNVGALTTAAQEVTSMLPFIRSTMTSMAQKNLSSALSIAGPNLDMLNSLKSGLNGLTKPIEQLETLERDIQATLAMSSSLLRGVIPHDTAVPVLKARMTDNFSIVDSFTSAAMGVFNDYNPFCDNTAVEAHKALKATAPTPMASLALGDISSFQQALVNPLAITAIGPAMQAMSDFLAGATNLTIVETMVANELMDFITQEHTRESITTYLADPDLQKAMAIQGLKKYITTQLSPVKTLVQLQKQLNK